MGSALRRGVPVFLLGKYILVKFFRVNAQEYFPDPKATFPIVGWILKLFGEVETILLISSTI